MDAVAASADHILGERRGSLATVEGCVNWGVGGSRAFLERNPAVWRITPGGAAGVEAAAQPFRAHSGKGAPPSGVEMVADYSAKEKGGLILSGVVGRGGLEPPASALSEQCSNQLSYRPDWRSGGKRGANSVECTCVGLNMSTRSWTHGSAPSRAIAAMARLGAATWRRTTIRRRARLAHQHWELAGKANEHETCGRQWHGPGTAPAWKSRGSAGRKPLRPCAHASR